MTNNAKSLLSFTGAFAFSVVPSPLRRVAEDDSLQKVVDAGVLRVAAEPGTPPMLFKEGNRYDGFDYAIAKAVAKRIGVDDVVIVAGKYSELPARLIAGKADVIISGYTADDSITGIDWSESYLDYGLCLIVKKGRGVRSTERPARQGDRHLQRPGRRRRGQGDEPRAVADREVRGRLLRPPRPGQDRRLHLRLPLCAGGDQGVRRPARDRRVQSLEVDLQRRRPPRRRDAPEDGRTPRCAASRPRTSTARSCASYLGGTGPAPVAKVAAGQSVYKVRPGDTLSGIARDQLGNMRRWTEIWEANRNRIADPNLIDIGWELVLPAR